MENKLFDMTYKKSLGRNYMCLKPYSEAYNDDLTPTTEYMKDFRIRMITENHIEGMLNTHVQYINDIPVFYYDITGFQSLEVALDNTSLDYNTLCLIFSSIYTGLLSCENFMLKQDNLLLSPEHIFISPDLHKLCLCYFPLKNSDLTASIRILFDYLLKKVNHTDEQCVYLAYTMHRECHENDFTINKLYSCLSSVPTMQEDSYNDETLLQPEAAAIPDITEASLPIANLPLQKNSFFNRFLSGVKNKFSNVFMDQTSDFKPLYELSVSEDFHYDESIHDTTTYDNSSGTTSRTVLLSSSESSDSHMLIYTGTDTNSKIKITHYPFTIGKNEGCDCILSNPMISRLHGRISCLPENDDSLKYYIEDLNSTNGTFLNNTSLTPYQKYPLTSGDYISFAHLTYIFR